MFALAYKVGISNLPESTSPLDVAANDSNGLGWRARSTQLRGAANGQAGAPLECTLVALMSLVGNHLFD